MVGDSVQLTEVRAGLKPFCVWVRKHILTRRGVALRRLQRGAVTDVASGGPRSVPDFCSLLGSSFFGGF